MNDSARRFWASLRLSLGSRSVAIRGLLAAVMVVGLAGAARAQIPYTNLDEPKYAAIVVDANSGEVLYAKSADGQRYPASLTKIMTLYLAFEAVGSGQLSLNDTLIVSPRAAAQAPTKLGLRAGDTISVGDAMHAVAVKSANDMAVALAERIGGTESRFAALMTLRARELGMSNTRYVNASGLPDSRQTSSARDIAILSRAVMRDYPQFYGFFSQKQFAWRGQLINNHNHLLQQMPGVDGIKTGFTNASGYNLAASAMRNNRRLIAVVLGGNSSAARDNHVQDLLETGFDVLNRRQRGEVITVAQNLFEPAPVGPLVRPSVEQGDEDAEAPVRVAALDKPRLRGSQPVETGAAVGVSADKVLRDLAVKGNDRTAKADDRKGRKGRVEKAAAKGDAVIQVGAFRQKALAKAELKRITRRFSAKLEDAEGQVVGAVGGEFRARFTGLTAAAARSACASIKAAGQVCMIVGR